MNAATFMQLELILQLAIMWVALLVLWIAMRLLKDEAAYVHYLTVKVKGGK